MLRAERLKDNFLKMLKIDSPSREELELALFLKEELEALGAKTSFDAVNETIGGSIGNLIAFFPGNLDIEAILLSAHMDTVEPGRGVKPFFENGIFRSDGRTILGADDKSGIAIILELLYSLKEDKKDHGPLEIVFSICEEIGLLGAKHLDKSRLKSRLAYVLDSWNVKSLVTRAPAANRLKFIVHGKKSHAGASPEKGINAIVLASKAIALCPDGRIDDETTCNIGRIEGGTATNIVPDYVVVSAEVRSHKPEKLAMITDKMVFAFKNVISDFNKDKKAEYPSLEVEIEEDFPHLNISENDFAVKLAKKAAANLNKTLDTASVGGGSDANILFNKGISACVMGTGMKDVHTNQESIALDDMLYTAELLQEIVYEYARGR